MSQDKTPKLSEVIRQGIKAELGEKHVAMPCVVTNYDADKNEADVQPVMTERFKDGSYKPFPIIPGVPVQFPEFGMFSIRGSLAKDQEVLLIVAERSIDEWYVTGSTGSDPKDPRRFDLRDGFVIPGIRNSKNPNTPKGDSFVIGTTNSSIEIRFSPNGKIYIGSPGVDLLGTLDSFLEALQTAVTATVLGPQPLDPGTQVTLAALRSALATIKE